MVKNVVDNSNKMNSHFSKKYAFSIKLKQCEQMELHILKKEIKIYFLTKHNKEIS